MTKTILDASVTSRDADLAAQIGQDDIRRCLAARGWQKTRDLESGCELWAKHECEQFAQVYVTDPQVRDHALRVGELIRAVARIEDVPVLRLVLELMPGLEVGEKGDRRP